MQETREIRAVVVEMELVQVASIAPRRPDAPVLYSKPKRKQSHRDSEASSFRGATLCFRRAQRCKARADTLQENK